MKFNLEEAIKYPISDPNWKKKTLVYVAIFGAVQLLSGLGSFFSNYILPLLSGDSDGEALVAIWGLSFVAMLVFAIFIYLPLSIYRGGYVIEIIKSRVRGDKEIPELTPIGQKFKNWFHLFLIGLPIFFFSLLLIFFFIALMAILFTLIPENSPLIFLGIFVIFFGVIMIILTIILTSAISAAIFYRYTTNGNNLSEAFDLATALNTIKRHWLTLLVIYGLNMAFSFGIAVLSLMSWIVLMGWLVGPILMIIYDFYSGYIVGEGFRNMYEEDLLALNQKPEKVEQADAEKAKQENN